MEEQKGADPKIIVAVQMTSIGTILIILGLTVFILSMLSMAGLIATANPWTTNIKTNSIISNALITLIGVGFAIGGVVLLKRAKKQT
jgi:threonine/homoserine/homoserine lactone efflux protein